MQNSRAMSKCTKERSCSLMVGEFLERSTGGAAVRWVTGHLTRKKRKLVSFEGLNISLENLSRSGGSPQLLGLQVVK